MTTRGYIDLSGELVIPSTSGSLFGFNEGLARTSVKGGWAFIDTKGRVTLEVERALQGFSDGLALCGDGFVDKRGKLVLPVTFKENFTKYVVKSATYSLVAPFSSGLAWVMRPRAKGVDAYINRKGDVVLDGFGGGLGRTFVDGKAHVTMKVPPKGERSRLIDVKGTCLASFDLNTIGRFSDGLALAMKGRNFGFIDEAGHWVLGPKFAPWNECLWECGFGEGLAPVKVKGRYGFIDKKGELVITPRFDGVRGTFSQGVAAVKEGEKFGYVNMDGSWAIEPRFTSAQPFSHGLAVVS